ncbi:vWA domain-containing protein [Oleiagrimonas soli]|uniref:BatB protein n=1 Tax=Oleiagrimonas soli TaxID=1543381 RepID=A0A099CT21_9GAMM|nr:VWA domain-containing protein [Oleiagrimonas soli]KGI76836.1 BatB protein [Oleiagrimonas soli]MBB6185316.1 Ca-activated chloride channel family protein [Oleiagrimonas soli]
MIDFAWPWLFLLLPLPWLCRRWLPPHAPSRALRLPHRDLSSLLAQSPRGSAMLRGRGLLWTLMWCCLLAAAARPQWIGPPQPLERSGRGVMLAVDMSGSMSLRDMQLGDVPVSRFGAVRAIVGDFIDRRAGDQVGLILFGTRAYLVTPLTYDLDAVRAQLRDVAVGLAGRNTAIGDAIAVAVRRLRKLPGDDRVLVLLTDGVNNAGSIAPMDAARIAKKAGVRIYTIGIGAVDNGPLDLFGNPMGGQGLDEDALRSIAEMTGGKFYRATDTRELAQAYRAIDALEPTLKGNLMRRPREPLYPWPLAAALLLALLGWSGPSWRREATT